jgi:diacylglycerol kinase family enzyme
MRALLIWNPYSGQRLERRRHLLKAAIGILRAEGWQVDVAETDAETGGRRSAQRGIEQGYDILIACGGDGTLRQVAGELARAQVLLGQRNGSGGVLTDVKIPAFAVFPFGTANVFAREIRVPRNPVAAARMLVRGRPHPIPLGRVTYGNGEPEYFLAVASAGFDAHIVRSISIGSKRRWGQLAYILTGMREFFTYRHPRMMVGFDGTRSEATLVIFGLTRYYGGGFRLTSVRHPLSPTLLLLRGGRALLLLQSLFLLLGHLHRAPGVRQVRGSHLEILTPGIDFELDGDEAGSTPVRLEYLPDSLNVLLPEEHHWL